MVPRTVGTVLSGSFATDRHAEDFLSDCHFHIGDVLLPLVVNIEIIVITYKYEKDLITYGFLLLYRAWEYGSRFAGFADRSILYHTC